MIWMKHARAGAFTLACALAVPAYVHAQAAASATVTGVVRDTTEAVVVGASVELRNHATNQMLATVTDGQGRNRHHHSGSQGQAPERSDRMERLFDVA